MKRMTVHLLLVLLLAPGMTPIACTESAAPTDRSAETVSPPPTPGDVYVNEIALAKELFLSEPSLGIISDIRVFEQSGSSETKVVIAGSQTALVADLQGRAEQTIRYRGLSDDVLRSFQIVDIEGDGRPEFLTVLPEAAGVALFGDNGRRRWTYDQGLVTSSTPVRWTDLDDDGILEVLICCSDGVHVVEADGTLRTRYRYLLSDEPQRADAAVVAERPDARLLVAAMDGTMTWWTMSDGKLRHAEGCPGRSTWAMDVIRWPRDESRLTLFDDGAILRLDNRRILAYGIRAPSHPSFNWVRSHESRWRYLAVSGELPLSSDERATTSDVRGCLFVYDRSARSTRLVYHEELALRGHGAAVIPSEVAGQEALLIGTTGKVWRYEAGTGQAGQPAIPAAALASSADHPFAQFRDTVQDSKDYILVLACTGNSLRQVRAAIEMGANVNVAVADGYVTDKPPLHLTRNVEIAEYLIAHGADVNAIDAEGLTALQHAQRSGNQAMADLLLSHGATPIDADIPPTASPEE